MGLLLTSHEEVSSFSFLLGVGKGREKEDGGGRVELLGINAFLIEVIVLMRRLLSV